MTEFLIGTGGWAYFRVPGLSTLEAYSRAFNFVEINSSFYQIPSRQTVESWRRKVPEDFEFSVRCHKDVTHKYELQPAEEALDKFQTMIVIVHALNSRFLVLETPSSQAFDEEKIKSARDFFESFDTKRIKIAWEIRRQGDQPVLPSLLTLMRDYNIIQCTDFSREDVVVQSDTIYTRVFGKGEHNLYQFADEELLDLDSKMKSKDVKTAVVSFHNVRMYKDAARYKIYKKTGRFPSATGALGQQSLRRILTEDSKFPTTKTELLRTQGWKVVDLNEDHRVHARLLFEKLPNLNFRSAQEVIDNLLGSSLETKPKA